MSSKLDKLYRASSGSENACGTPQARTCHPRDEARIAGTVNGLVGHGPVRGLRCFKKDVLFGVSLVGIFAVPSVKGYTDGTVVTG